MGYSRSTWYPPSRLLSLLCTHCLLLGYLRTNSSSYTEAYTPYWEYMAEITAKNQITAGGPIILIQIDNEYVQYDSSGGNPGKAGYFDDLEKALRKKGVVIPTTYNDPGMNGNFVSGEGKVDIYGIDSYPGVRWIFFRSCPTLKRTPAHLTRNRASTAELALHLLPSRPTTINTTSRQTLPNPSSSPSFNPAPSSLGVLHLSDTSVVGSRLAQIMKACSISTFGPTTSRWCRIIWLMEGRHGATSPSTRSTYVQPLPHPSATI